MEQEKRGQEITQFLVKKLFNTIVTNYISLCFKYLLLPSENVSIVNNKNNSTLNRRAKKSTVLF